LCLLIGKQIFDLIEAAAILVMRGHFSNALARCQVEIYEPIEIFHQFRTHDVASSQMTHRRLFRLVLLPTLAFIGGLMACDAVTRVQGTVVGRDGNPIPGAVVRLTLIATGRASGDHRAGWQVLRRTHSRRIPGSIRSSDLKVGVRGQS